LSVDIDSQKSRNQTKPTQENSTQCSVRRIEASGANTFYDKVEQEHNTTEKQSKIQSQRQKQTMMQEQEQQQPHKDVGGDPLFDAALQCTGPRTFESGSTIILTEHQPHTTHDPSFDKLFTSSSPPASPNSTSAMAMNTMMTLPAMHNYYGEFRLGHGDPLFKAAMKRWDCTTTDYSVPEIPDIPKIHAQARSKSLGATPTVSSCRALMESTGRDIVAAPSSSSMWPFVDIVELDHLQLEAAMVKERRFVLLDEQGRPVAEAEDDDDNIEEIYSDFIM
jgi:hypothetical protein